MQINPQEAYIARQTLERYSASEVEKFYPNLILTNFPRYVEYFATTRNVPIIEDGAVFKDAPLMQQRKICNHAFGE